MNILKTISDLLKNTLIGGAILLGTLTMYGQWIMMYVYGTKQDHIFENDEQIPGNNTIKWVFDNFQTFWIYVMVSSYAIYFTSGLFLYYYYYILRRDRADEWKCQPNRWPSNKVQLDEIKMGITGALISNTCSVAVSTYMSNGGHYCNVYYKWDEYSLLYLILQGPIVFIVTEYATYWLHRIFHWPIFYKMFHYVHHKYTCPTAFAVTATHPIEMVLSMATLYSPLFNPIFPIYLPIISLYGLYYYAMQILYHSGIYFKPQWWQPWQPETMFHDNHHQYFHVNFGFNTKMFDQIHGTTRQVDRIYTEKIFWGKGKSIQEADQEEKAEYLRESRSENEKVDPESYNKILLLLKDKESS